MLRLNRNKFFSRYLPLALSVGVLVVAGIVYLTLRPGTKTAQAGWYSTGGTWTYRKSIIIDHTKVNTATGTTTPLANFPVEINITSADLATYASSTGADILFTSSDGTTKLNHEIETYASSTGQLIAWVQIPSLSSTADTTIYMYYGNSSATSQQNATSTWDTNFKAVYHMRDNAANTTVTDSTTVNNGTNAANTSGKTTTGKIASGLTYNGSTDKTDLGANSSLDISSNTITLEAWVKRNAVGSTGYIIEKGAVGTSGYSLGIGTNGCTTNQVDINKNGVTAPCIGSFPADTNFHHLVVSWGAGGAAVYIDGVSAGTNADTSNFTSSANHPFLGSTSAGASFFTGVIDEARISNTARTADWIATEYLNQSSPATFYAIGGTGIQNRAVNQGSVQITNRSWYNKSWAYRMPITISHNMVGSSTSANLNNFPVLVSLTNNNLRTVANGGGVGNDSGNDILFTDTDGATKLNHEIETYATSTGQLIAWVKVPFLSTTQDHVIYLYYGNNSALDQSNKTAVWTNYATVYHLPNGATLNYKDSTGNGNNLTASGTPTAVAGQIDGAASFASSAFATTSESSSLQFGMNSLSYSYWINTANSAQCILCLFNTVSGGGFRTVGNGTGIQPRISDGTHSVSGTVSANISNSAWHYFVVTINRSSNKMTGFVDGVAINGGDDISAVTGSITNSNAQLVLAAVYSGGSTYNTIFTGKFDEVRIANPGIVLSSDWITTEYLNQSSPGSYITAGSQQTRDSFSSATGWYNASWTNRRVITIDHTKISTVNGTTLTNFPIMFSTTDPDFRTIANGGHVASSSGADILFTDSDGLTKLSHELEFYASSTGQVLAWVKIPNLVPTTDKVIYMYYGNGSAASQQDAAGTWSNGYVGVWHMDENAATTTLADSSSSANNGVLKRNSSLMSTTGEINNALTFNGSTDTAFLATSTSLNITTASAMSAWFKTASGGINRIIGGGISANGSGYIFSVGSHKMVSTTGGSGFSSNTNVDDNIWHYGVAILPSTGSTNGTFYKDGLSDGSTSSVPTTYSGQRAIGTDYDGVSNSFNGTLDEIRLSNVTRSADWVKTEYANQFSPGTFYALSGATAQTRSAGIPLLNSRGGVKIR